MVQHHAFHESSLLSTHQSFTHLSSFFSLFVAVRAALLSSFLKGAIQVFAMNE